MTTPTEPAARLTVEPIEGSEQFICEYRMSCSHGSAVWIVMRDWKETPAYIVSWLADYIHDRDACHCADAIRARYGAGGEG